MERLEKNFMWLVGANIASTVTGALILIYVARTIEAEAFGYFSFATAIVFYLFNFIDLGLSTFGIREIARDRGASGEYVSSIVSFRLMIAAVIFVIFTAVSLTVCRTPVLRAMLAGTAILVFTSALATEWAFQGLERMNMVFVSYLVTPALQLAAVMYFVRSPSDAVKVPVALFVCSLPVVVTFLRRLGFRLMASRADLAKIRSYLSSSLVIWAISLFAQTYNNLDIVLLGLFRPPADVGCFTVARRAVGGIAVLMVMLANAVLPRLSSTFRSDTAAFRHATGKFLKISVLVMLAVFLPVFIFSERIITLTVGAEYLPAAAPLRIMLIALTLVLFNLPFSTGLIAACFERDVLKQAAASATLSLILNLVLMPKYGMIGGAVSFFFAEALALAWILTLYRIRIRTAKAAL